MPSNPWLKTLNLLQNTPQQLSALIQAKDPSMMGIISRNVRCQFIQIQFNVDAGAARLRIGNDDVSSSNYGVLLFASQAHTIYPGDVNSLQLDQIWLLCDTANEFVTVEIGTL